MSQGAAIDGLLPQVRPAAVEVAPKFSALLLSCAVAASVPIAASLYWFAYQTAPDAVGNLLRVWVLGCSVFLAAYWYRAPLSHAEVLLVRVFAFAAILWLVPTLLATNRIHALGGWVKLVLLFTICCCMARGLRHPPTSLAFGVASQICGILLVAFILLLYIKHAGFVLPTYKTAREFKGIALNDGIPLNSVAFAAVFSYVMGLCVMRTSRLLIFWGIPILLVSAFFTGSRASVVNIVVSLFVLLWAHGLRSRFTAVRIASGGVVLLALAGFLTLVSVSSKADLNHVTEGRYSLWTAGVQKFLDRPLFGFGYESWPDDLVSRLPGESDVTFHLAKQISGGYHNEYISVLAEEGIIGGLAAAIIIWLLLRCTWLLASRPWATVPSKAWPFFTAIFLLLRSNFEVPGLFGYGQEPADYLAYLFVAIVLSRFSIEEDFARGLSPRGAGVSV